MCGIGSGGFDCDWMLDCLEVASDESFRLNEKSTQNAEEYLLARYHLHINVYTHKTTRAAEMMLRDILFLLSENFESSGLMHDHPIKNYYEERSVETYLALDDIMIWSALVTISKKAKAKKLKDLTSCLLNRQFYKCFDVGALAEKEKDGAKKLKAFLPALEQTNANCVVDEASITAYPSQTKRNHDGIKIGKTDIATLSSIIAAVPVKKLTRVYAMKAADVNAAKALWKKL
jgi:HD superfamily phosphohydrolase